MKFFVFCVLCVFLLTTVSYSQYKHFLHRCHRDARGSLLLDERCVMAYSTSMNSKLYVKGGTTVRSNAIRYNRKIYGPSPIKTLLSDSWKLCHHHCERESESTDNKSEYLVVLDNCRSWTWILVPYGGVCHLYSVSNAPKRIQYGAVTGINIAASSP